MRELLWCNLGHIAAAFTLLAFWGVLRFTLATGGRYAKPRTFTLFMGLFWLALLVASAYVVRGFGLFGATMAVTLFADNHYYASLAGHIGPDRLHDRVTEVVRRDGPFGFLRMVLPSQLLHLALALILLGLTSGPRDWVFLMVLGFVAAHVMRVVSACMLAFKYRALRTEGEARS
jgi:hypothetical protein